MKKFIAVSLLALSFSSLAGTQADLILKGVVAPILDISIVHEPIASTLDLSKPASNLKVATLTEKSNNSRGYKILAKSINGGKLVHDTDSTSFVNYTLTYNNSNVPLNTNPNEVFTTNEKGVFTKDLKISYNQPSANLSAGLHQDTVQFTIVAN